MAFLTGGLLDFLSKIMEKAEGGTYDRTTDSNEAISEAIAGLGGGSSNQTITVTEQEAMVAGDIAVMTDQGGCVPFSSLQPTELTVIDTETTTEISSSTATDTSVDWITESIYISMWRTTSNPICTPVRVLSDGSTVIGADYVIDANIAARFQIANLNDNRFITFFDGTATADPSAAAGRLYPESLYLEFGTALSCEAINSNVMGVCRAADDKFMAYYNDQSGTDISLIAGSVNTSTLAITLGNPEVVGAGDCDYAAITNIEDDKIGFIFEDLGAASDGFCTIATLAALVITAGDDIEFLDADTLNGAVVISQGSNIVVAYKDANSEINTIAASISALVPTFGSPVAFTTATTSILPQLTKIDNKYYLVGWDDSVNGITKFKAGSRAGTVVASVGTEKRLRNDLPPSDINAKVLASNSFGDIVYIGVDVPNTNTYAVLLDIGWIDDTTNKYVLYDITGVTEDAAGTVIVDGIDEGNASGEDSRLTYFFDSGSSCVRRKGHSNTYGYKARVRVIAPDALKAIGG